MRSLVLDTINNNTMRTNFNSIILGFKKGYNIETLPSLVRLFLGKPIIRILRVIGGVCVLIYLCHKNGLISYNIPYYLNIIIIILALIQLIQIVGISIIKIVFGLNKLIKHRKEFEVRNSPLNRLASLTSNLVYCWKVGCQVGSSGVGLLGASVLIDGLLASAGQEKIFEPMMSKGINALVGGRQAKKVKLLETESAKHELLVKDLESSKNSIDELVKNKFFSAEDGKVLKDGLDELKNTDRAKLQERATSLKSE